MQRDQVGGRSLALQSPVQARARSPPARQMPDSAQTAASTMAQMSKGAYHQPLETNGSRPAATPPRRSPRPRLIDQPLSAPKSAADPHVAPPPAARATSTCPVTLDPTAVSLPSQHSSRSVLRRPVDSALAALVAMVDDFLRPTLANRHRHRVQHQLGAQVVCHRPADDLAAPGVEHDGQIEKSCCCRHIGDIGDPQLVWSGRAEVAVDQVGRGPGVLVSPGCDRATVAMAGAYQPGLAHQAGDPFSAVPLAAPTQISMDARRSIGLARTGTDGPDALQ